MVSLDPIIAYNEDALKELSWAIWAEQGQFSAIFARCNDRRFHDRLTQELQDQLRADYSLRGRKILVDSATIRLYDSIQSDLGRFPPNAAIVLGLESIQDLDELLKIANLMRPQFRSTFPFPLVLWTTNTVHAKWIRIAPDFESWFTSVQFSDLSD